MDEINPFSEIPACESYGRLFELFIFVVAMTFTLTVGALLILNNALNLNLTTDEITSFTQAALYSLICVQTLKELGIKLKPVWRDWNAKAGSDALAALKYGGIYLLLIAIMLAAAMLAIHFYGGTGAGMVRSFGAREEMYVSARGVMDTSRLRFAFLLFTFCVLAPIGEELFFRRIVYATMRKKLSFMRALFASSVIFAATHGAASLMVFPVSLLMGYVYEKKRRLPVNIMLHGLINLFAMSVRLT